jgi:hypothetical protein
MQVRVGVEKMREAKVRAGRGGRKGRAQRRAQLLTHRTSRARGHLQRTCTRGRLALPRRSCSPLQCTSWLQKSARVYGVKCG